MPRIYAQIAGLIGVGLFLTFVIGLVQSIALGFAGFKGALPAIIIVALVGMMAIYDYWDTCLRKKPEQ